MKFLRRKTGDKPAGDAFNDYVEPFPPSRRAAAAPMPAADPAHAPADPGDRVEEFDMAFEDGFDDAPEMEDDMDHGHDRTFWATRGTAFPSDAETAEAAARPVLFPGEAAPAARPQRLGAAEAADRRTALLNGYRPDADPAAPPAAPSAAPAMAAAPDPEPADLSAFEAPPPAAGRSGARAGRAKTRLLGFGQPADAAADPFARDEPAMPAEPSRPDFPVGWLVVVEGPGRGAHFTLFNGVSQIGRGADQTVRLDFGDTSISRSGHALLAFDDEQGKFFLGSGGKVNIVRLNGQPLLSTEELSNDDRIRIGETTLHFVAFCGPDFTWSADRPDADGR
ncbi:FHA domain-containing protein [Rhodovulum marinum]|uniref:FHA domain-containing protein n=1 Tax=Rhodovulum marinum TaxID=320662 RepID=A0A4R2Q8E0_9RHOB|nr:FHA domain-containing protein [Rhodovulum marinum]TCP44238.1 FHA domain-containing protein [Rhodovulum marinum]